MLTAPKKIAPYCCPKCGSSNYDAVDYDWDADTLCIEAICEDCDAQWNEYFSLKWEGYAYDNVDYDEKGEKMFAE